MAGFDENIVREYFELNGFFVRQLRKHALPTRKKSVEEANELVVYHPQTAEGSAPAGFQLFSSDMSQMRGALVAIKGWHHSRFSPAILKSSPKLFDFIKKEVLAKMDLHFQVEADDEADAEGQDYAGFLKILILPGFPTNEAHREECTELLKTAGVDGVIVFSTILENLLRHVEVNHSYQKSDVLQMLRVLKINDMIREPQMTLFS